jgi:hypothetical protein
MIKELFVALADALQMRGINQKQASVSMLDYRRLQQRHLSFAKAKIGANWNCNIGESSRDLKSDLKQLFAIRPATSN